MQEKGRETVKAHCKSWPTARFTGVFLFVLVGFLAICTARHGHMKAAHIKMCTVPYVKMPAGKSSKTFAKGWKLELANTRE